MQHFEAGWSATDGLVLFAQGWQPEGNAKAAVCLVHGLGEHSGRYPHVAVHLCQAGYGLLAFDLRGHGRSAGARGHSPRYDALLDDIGLLLAEAARCFPGSPAVLYGHSLGGGLVLNYVLRRKPQLAGAIATGPLLRTAFAPPAWKLMLGKALCRVWPGLTMSSELDAQAMSHDSDVVRRYSTDPLNHDRLSARLGVDILEAGAWALEHAAEFPVPLLLMHGDGDRVTSARASHEFAARVGQGCTLRIWPGLYHEIHNEPDRFQVLAYLTAWLDGIFTR